MLVLEHVTKRYGGLAAVDDVSLELRPREVLGLIGPNGSGKTTLFNVISGLRKPDRGRISLQGRDITGRPPDVVARAGIARTHQIVQPLPGLSVRDNVAVGACFGRQDLALVEAYVVADRVLEEVGLAAQSSAPASRLNLSEKKRLELARALASDPVVMLLDEPLAGLNPPEAAAVVGIVRAARERGVSLIIVEHLMQAIMGLCDRIVVLEAGRVIAEGPPIEVTNDPRVVEAYLGDPALVEPLLGQV